MPEIRANLAGIGIGRNGDLPSCAESAPGSGLGLSIVDDLTRAYGGRLALADSDMGGLKAMLELPAAQS